ncbi:MAG: NAD-dependent epimerase/dehydratase family protein [Verrucomicrobiota bacterium]
MKIHPTSTESSALIGYTGLVGSNLTRQHQFDELFNSSNIQNIVGKHYQLLICSGASGTKWLANKEPERDQKNIASLIEKLKKVKSDCLILISTVDVYGIPDQVDEDTPIDITLQTPYGRHRYQLEQMVSDYFPQVLTVRLPAIYGWGLKKNALYDLMHSHEVEKIHPEAIYQFYWLEHLWRDIQRALSSNLTLVNFATEPSSIRSVAKDIFDIDLNSGIRTPASAYDFRTKYGAAFGSASSYLYDRATVMDEIRAFVAQQQIGLFAIPT